MLHLSLPLCPVLPMPLFHSSSLLVFFVFMFRSSHASFPFLFSARILCVQFPCFLFRSPSPFVSTSCHFWGWWTSPKLFSLSLSLLFFCCELMLGHLHVLLKLLAASPQLLGDILGHSRGREGFQAGSWKLLGIPGPWTSQGLLGSLWTCLQLLSGLFTCFMAFLGVRYGCCWAC